MTSDQATSVRKKVGTMPAISERDYYTVPQAAKLLDVSPATVWRWIAAEKLSAYRVGPRVIRIRKQDLETVIKPAKAKDVSMDEEGLLLQPVSEAELARRQALVAKILTRREERNIAPLTSADLVREARKKEMHSYDPGH